MAMTMAASRSSTLYSFSCPAVPGAGFAAGAGAAERGLCAEGAEVGVPGEAEVVGLESGEASFERLGEEG